MAVLACRPASGVPFRKFSTRRSPSVAPPLIFMRMNPDALCRRGALLFVMATLLVAGCASDRTVPGPNTLGSREQREGWKLLFDGKTTGGWRGFGKPAFPDKGWVVEDGWLRHVPKAGGGDIVTQELFTDFEFEFEWRIAAGANSGVKYLIDEKRGSAVGHEYQVIDDALHPDAAHGPKRQTAALYDALPPQAPPIRPAGEINQSRIRVNGDQVGHWLNGRKVLGYTLGSPELMAAKAASKFSKESRWGTKFPTPILLQDHQDEVWYRNLRIRAL